MEWAVSISQIKKLRLARGHTASKGLSLGFRLSSPQGPFAPLPAQGGGEGEVGMLQTAGPPALCQGSRLRETGLQLHK